jgi:hypothetical protein
LVTLANTQHLIMAYEMNRSLLLQQQAHAALLSEKLRAILALGASISRMEYETAARQSFAAAMAGIDALIVPPALGIGALRPAGYR